MRNWKLAAVLATYGWIFLGTAAHTQRVDDPLLRPMAVEQAKNWLRPEKPLHVHGNSYLVGFAGISVALIKTDAGLILIDGALPQAVPAIEANLRALGFSISDVKLILSTEPHSDHAGGLAALARDSGATVVASGWAANVLRTGRRAADDPQAAWLETFPGVARVRVVRDGEAIRLGSVVVTARATPGHTPGSMSWTWRSCEGRSCLNMVFGASLNPMAADGWRFSDPAHAGTVASFRRTFARFRALPCDVLFSAHPDQSDQDVRAARFRASPSAKAFIDRNACRAYADKNEARLDRKIAEGK